MNHSRLVEELAQWSDLIDQAYQQKFQTIMFSGDIFNRAANAIKVLLEEVDCLQFEYDLLVAQVQQDALAKNSSELSRKRLALGWESLGAKS